MVGAIAFVQPACGAMAIRRMCGDSRSCRASFVSRAIRAVVLAATSGSSSAASVARWRSSMVCAAASNFSARCVNSVRVPLRCLDALLGNLTPSIANISRPIRPWPSHTVSTAAKTLAMSSRSVLTKWAIVVKCGAVMPHSAMNVTCSWQTRSIARLRTMPCE